MIFVAYFVQEFLVDGSNRTAVGNQIGSWLDPGGGAFGAGPTDYSTFDALFENIQPYAAVGQHEFECNAAAYPFDFDTLSSNTVRTTAVASFTGKIQTCRGALSCAACGPCCAADVVSSGAVGAQASVGLITVCGALHNDFEHMSSQILTLLWSGCSGGTAIPFASALQPAAAFPTASAAVPVASAAPPPAAAVLATGAASEDAAACQKSGAAS